MSLLHKEGVLNYFGLLKVLSSVVQRLGSPATLVEMMCSLANRSQTSGNGRGYADLCAEG